MPPLPCPVMGRQLCYAASRMDPLATRGRCRPGRKPEGRGSRSGAGGPGKTSLYLLWGVPVVEAPAPNRTA